jgi:hypothetical protein
MLLQLLQMLRLLVASKEHAGFYLSSAHLCASGAELQIVCAVLTSPPPHALLPFPPPPPPLTHRSSPS